MFSILHISDLHRQPGEEITTATLLNSLERDRERYALGRHKIPSPSIVIVSGDIIHGAARGVTDAAAELDRQYSDAEDFLIAVAESFLEGDRTKIVIIPGNHDVCFADAVASMHELPLPKGKLAGADIANQLFAANSKFRWDWHSLTLHEIVDRNRYDSRFDSFAKFYERFYKGARRYSRKPDQQFEIFDYPEFGVAIVAFNSCYDNDPWNRRGAIHPDCISEVGMQLRKDPFRDRLILATWHHNTSGPPMQTDYMDADTLQVLIDIGVSVGLHGHQHKSQFVDERFRFGEDRKITVVSAGTLCGGPKSLKAGRVRSYNVIEIALDALRGRVVQRVMRNDDFALPIWNDAADGLIEFRIQAPLRRTSERGGISHALAAAESEIQAGRYEAAIRHLTSVSDDPLAKRFLLECYIALDRHREIVDTFWPPVSVGEIVAVADALWSLQETSRLRQLLELEHVAGCADPAIREIRTLYKARLT